MKALYVNKCRPSILGNGSLGLGWTAFWLSWFMLVEGLRYKRFLCLEADVAAKAYSVHSTAEVAFGVVMNPRDNMIGSRSSWVIIGRKVLVCHKASFIMEISMANWRKRKGGGNVTERSTDDDDSRGFISFSFIVVDHLYLVMFCFGNLIKRPACLFACAWEYFGELQVWLRCFF